MKLAFYAKDFNPELKEKFFFMFNYFHEKGVRLYYYHKLYKAIKDDSEKFPKGKIFSTSDDLEDDIDMMITLGGDGTFIGSIFLIKNKNIPVVGINFGRLGFLTATKFAQKQVWMNRIIEGDYHYVGLPLLKLCLETPLDIFKYAVNEISVQRTIPTLMGIDVKINGHAIPTYWADGFIIATSTGSTAYSLSVGGPIVTPSCHVFILSPIASHNLNMRPLVITDDSEIEVSLQSRADDAVLSVDNKSIVVSSDFKFKVCKSTCTIPSIIFSDKNAGFFQALHDKLSWGADQRNF
ncbi:MAG: NAD(+)/NADH kinase [Bacteroidales bacterium]